MAGPIELLRANRRQIVRAAETVGRGRLRQALARAQRGMAERLRRAEGLGGPGKDSFTAAQLRAAMGQVRLVLSQLSGDLGSIATDAAVSASDPAVEGVIRYLQAAEQRFSGVSERLPLRDAVLFDRALSGVRSSALHRLEGDPQRGPGILERYGDAVVERFEGHMQQRLLARTSWADVRNGLIADSPFLQQAPAFWAERIVRTEAMNGSNRAIWEANQEADAQLGDVVKILAATFDQRTGADSVAVHGQIRRPSEAFQWWDGLYQHPPNRPNDREVVVTHRLSWPLPAELAWRSDAEVAARWLANGRRGAPPARPKMTTVPVEQFGKAAPPAVEGRPEEPQRVEPQQEPAPIARRQAAEQQAPDIAEMPGPRDLIDGAEAARVIAGRGLQARGEQHYAAWFGDALTEENIRRVSASDRLAELRDTVGGRYVGGVYADDSQLRVFGRVYGPNNERTAHIDRRFERGDSGELVVHHELFKLDASHQGKGLGKQIISEQLAAYEMMGVDRIELLSAWEGRYVWPKWGFELRDPGEMASIRKDLRSYMVRHRGISEEAAAAIAEQLDSIHDVAMLAVDGKRIGKDFLLSPHYEGSDLTLSLRPGSEGLRRLKAELHGSGEEKKA